MKIVSKVLAVVGVLLFACACVGRFINGSTVFGCIAPCYALEAKTVVLGATSLMVMAVLAFLFAGDKKQG